MIKLIAAMTKNGVIGKGNSLPWNIPDELKNFRQQTQDHTVIMGMRTFESIGKPLPRRHNIVLSAVSVAIDHVDVCTSIDQALHVAGSYGKDIFIIGGAYTYAQFINDVDLMYISYIKKDYDGDVFFPPIDWSQWIEKERTDYPEFELVIYQRLEKRKTTNEY
jgi:dihydrofolate reductase